MDAHENRPGDAIAKLMRERGWSQVELAYVLGMHSNIVSALINSKSAISPEMAKRLGVAFGRPPIEFAALQAAWSLSQAPDPDPEIHARAQAQTDFPLREMVKRGWIGDPKQGAGAHAELCRFFGVNSLEDAISLAHAPKKSGASAPTGEQLAWLYRVRAIAREMLVPAYSTAKLSDALDRMSLMRESPEEARHIPRLLNEAGVRFVIVEGLPGGRIDGVCTWLNAASPVIGLSLRFDRIDNFWFVLRHECAHVMHGHGKAKAIIDSDVGPSDDPISDEEAIANAEAADFCVPKDKMASFYMRKNPFFSDQDIQAFSKINRTHPGLVVGQLQHLTGHYNLLRRHLVAVRKYITPVATTEGWGHSVVTG